MKNNKLVWIIPAALLPIACVIALSTPSEASEKLSTVEEVMKKMDELEKQAEEDHIKTQKVIKDFKKLATNTGKTYKEALNEISEGTKQVVNKGKECKRIFDENMKLLKEIERLMQKFDEAPEEKRERIYYEQTSFD